MKFHLAGGLYLALCAAALAQQVLTNESVEKMAKARLSDDVIISMIQSQEGRYEVTPEALIALKKKGISDKVLAALAAKGNGTRAPAAPAPTPPAVAADPYEELDIGVYRKVRQTWTTIASEAVNWKTSGGIRGLIANGTISKGATGRLVGGSSPTQMNAPLEFIIKTADGVDATDFQLVLLHDKNDGREFRTLADGGTQNQIGFEQTRIAKRTYKVVLAGKLSPGEYAFLIPGLINSSAGSIGKAYTFRLVE